MVGLPTTREYRLIACFQGLSKSGKQDIRDEYANARNFCDGDIFQQIRIHQGKKDRQAEGRWLARLSEGKRKDLKQLQRRLELRRLAEALNQLLPYTGFWPSLQIGTFHRILNLKCPEVSESLSLVLKG